MSGELKSVERRLAAAYIGWRDSAGCGDTEKVIVAFRELEAAERAYRSGREGEYEKITDPATGETLYRRPAAPPEAKPPLARDTFPPLVMKTEDGRTRCQTAILGTRQQCRRDESHDGYGGLVSHHFDAPPSGKVCPVCAPESSSGSTCECPAPAAEPEPAPRTTTTGAIVSDLSKMGLAQFVEPAKPEPAPSPALAALESIIARSPHPERFAAKEPTPCGTCGTEGAPSGKVWTPIGSLKPCPDCSPKSCATCAPPHGDGRGYVASRGPDGEPNGKPCPACRPGGAT